MADLGAQATKLCTIATRVLAAAPAAKYEGTRYAKEAKHAKRIPVWGYPLDLLHVTATMLVPSNGRIYGTILEEGVGVAFRPVRCYHRKSGNVVDKGVTDGSGNYEFRYLDPTDEYTIVAVDSTNTFNAVVQDRVVPEVIV